MNLAGLILKTFGWSVDITVPDHAKCIICVAPHTSNWDFVIGKLAYASTGRKAGFLMKETWFFWPLKYLLLGIGGIPVPRRKKGTSLVETIVKKFDSSPRLTIAITPEGTRSRQEKWHTGFLHIAEKSGAHIVLGVIDFSKKKVSITKEFISTGNTESDMRQIKDYYKDFKGKYPGNFCTD